MKRTITNTLILLAATGALAACKTTAPDVLPPDPSGSGSGMGDGTQGTQSSGPVLGTQAHFEGEVGSNTTIFFDTDRYNIDSVDAAALSQQAQYLLRYPNITVTVEGHCDERGTRDYNLALGERRANAAKNYLVGLGIDAARIRTVSYGKERPVALGSSESAWAQNRRAVTMVIG